MATNWRIITKDVLSALRHTDGENDRAVFFIHGFIGHPEKTWVNTSNKASFPELIFSDPALSDYDVFSFQCRSTVIDGTEIKKVSLQLADEIRRVGPYEQIVFITHSMGGLIAMRYILNQLARGDDLPVRGLLLYGSPLNGSYLVAIANMAGTVLQFIAPRATSLFKKIFRGNPQAEQLGPASDFLQELNDEWALRVVNGGNSREEAKRRAILPVSVVTGTKDLVVKEISAKGTYGSIEWHPVDYGHIDLVKPVDHEDVRYKNAKEFLELCRPNINRAVMLRLRQLSDSLLTLSSQRVCSDWNYSVHVHGGAEYANDDRLLAGGFSPFVVKKCQYRTFLSGTSIYIGFAWDEHATREGWQRQPNYVHQILARDMSAVERNVLSIAIDEVMKEKNSTASWSALFPEMSVVIAVNATRFVLEAAEVERDDYLLLRRFILPPELQKHLNRDVTFNVTFRSYVPSSATSFTLVFPWLHVGFSGSLTVHGRCRDFSLTQLIAGGDELSSDAQYYDHRSQLVLKTNDIVLPNSRAEIAWKATTHNGGSP